MTIADITKATAIVTLGGLSHTYEGAVMTDKTTPASLMVTFTYNRLRGGAVRRRQLYRSRHCR
ncbi:hypothetical protein Dform_01835 [Dehalogenimonas formicexedens]|uniref:MBG domain-containing protein n=1 Tax=Dehalogenimonas formicexedens TaxID=1839801 RepID=A0A1P8F9L3_9CHLR|nr:hypothetical protein Dform_01835 [Dehalogenimonas formicexedens]